MNVFFISLYLISYISFAVFLFRFLVSLALFAVRTNDNFVSFFSLSSRIFINVGIYEWDANASFSHIFMYVIHNIQFIFRSHLISVIPTVNLNFVEWLPPIRRMRDIVTINE